MTINENNRTRVTMRLPFLPIYHCHWKISINSFHSNESNIWVHFRPKNRIVLMLLYSQRKMVESFFCRNKKQKMVGMLATYRGKKEKMINITKSRNFCMSLCIILTIEKKQIYLCCSCSLNKNISNAAMAITYIPFVLIVKKCLYKFFVTFEMNAFVVDFLRMNWIKKNHKCCIFLWISKKKSNSLNGIIHLCLGSFCLRFELAEKLMEITRKVFGAHFYYCSFHCFFLFGKSFKRCPNSI